MSNKIESKVFRKIKDDFEKSRKFINDSLIIYSEDNYESEFFELMKNGYLEMAEINLKFSGYNSSSQEESYEYKFDDINEYEKWLCGVWYF